jgi:hypothetical protein
MLWGTLWQGFACLLLPLTTSSGRRGYKSKRELTRAIRLVAR